MLYTRVSIKWAYGTCSSKIRAGLYAIASLYDFNKMWELSTKVTFG
jgi:hypothetical protein